ncbi:chloride channel CLIC-like protein 1 isoform X1 [Alosa pseudoharengus]|uniref:chloride channel CLIC-like protein 1 isoform X1 n=1 Tax=Alosa pseudoharengus TaxID=34774 RepID=UPI003F8898FD
MVFTSLFTEGKWWVIFGLSSLLLLTQGQDDDWVDPFDMLNYDATSKSMRKPPEAASYDNVPTKRREYVQEPCPPCQCPDISQCNKNVEMLQRELHEHKRTTTSLLQPATCNPIFKRFISKLLKEISRLGLSNESPNGMYYDAKVHLSSRTMAELQKVVVGETWTTGSLDDALSKILVDFKPHDYEAWKWRFEDTFGVELDTVVKTSVFVLVIVMIICSELWSTVSWFVQFKRMFAICFFISIVWNWFYLYKIAFAEHQTNIVKMESVNDKCTGVKKIDWKDNLKEWFRSTWTLQDDPCKKYYEVLMVNPILLVPPTKAISVTITTFITEPLKHLGQGISEFLRALLKDLPVTLQIPVLLTIVLSIVVCTYGSAQTAIQHVLTGPLRRGRRDPPPPPNRLQDRGQHPQLEQGEDSNEEDEDDQHHLGAGDAPLPIRGLDQRGRARGGGARGEGWRQEVRRRPVRPKENQRRVFVETLRNADHRFSGDETDQARLPEQGIEREGEVREDVAEGDQAAAAEEVVKDEKLKEKHADKKEQPVNKKEQPSDKKEQRADRNVNGIDSPHTEPGSEGERTMRPSDQQSTASTQSQEAAAPEQITSLQGLNAEEASSEQKDVLIKSGHVEDIGVPVQESGL